MNKDFWEYFFRIGNGESLRGVSKDLGVPFQTVWSAIMSDEKRRATYEDAKMSRAHFHASKIEEILEDVGSNDRFAGDDTVAGPDPSVCG